PHYPYTSLFRSWSLILVTYILFRRRGIQGATFTMPGGSVTAALGISGLLAVFATVFVRDSMQIAAAVGIPAVLVATALYFTVIRRRLDQGDIDEAFAEAERMR